MNFDTEYLAKLDHLLNILTFTGIKNPLVAGGAIRDMLFDKPIKDIDVFYSKYIWATAHEAPLKYGTFITNVECHTEKYEGSKFQLTHSFDFSSFPGTRVQLIKTELPPQQHVENFPIDICCVSYGSINGESNQLHIPNFVMECYNNKKVYCSSDVNEEYLNRIQQKYPEYEFIK